MVRFTKHVTVTKYKLTLILLGNYQSHLSLRVLGLAKEMQLFCCLSHLMSLTN
jgi:hypothetical protein